MASQRLGPHIADEFQRRECLVVAALEGEREKPWEARGQRRGCGRCGGS
jgi:hypothetical protein